MIEIKGREFDGELEQIIKDNDDIRVVFEEIYTYDIDEDSSSWS